MTQYLPPNLLALFAPRDPIPYVPPLDVLPWEKKPWPYTGIAEYVQLFEDPGETPPATRAETKEERTARKQLERKDRHSAALKEQVDKWDVENDPNVDGDPFKTLFVGRINYDTSESKLRREFEQYGRIKRIHMVMNSETGKPRGYAFIEYEKERDMHAAYKQADGRKIDGKRVVVDVERGRTVKSWQPRRLGGGLGGTRRGGPNDNIKYSGRIDERDINDERRSRDGDRERKRSRSRDRERRRRSRSRDKGSQRERSRSRERRDSERRDRPRDRDRDRERSGRRDKDRERDRDRDKERSKDRHHRTDKDRSDRSGRKRERDSRDREERSDKKAKVDSRDSRSNGAEGTAEVKTES